MKTCLGARYWGPENGPPKWASPYDYNSKEATRDRFFGFRISYFRVPFFGPENLKVLTAGAILWPQAVRAPAGGPLGLLVTNSCQVAAAEEALRPSGGNSHPYASMIGFGLGMSHCV